MKRMLCNPYLPFHEYVPDGEPYVFGDRLYVYGSHDEANNPAFCVKDYAVWSAPLRDLSDWKCEGVSYRRTDDPHNRDGKHALFAPDVAEGKDGKYYLYYCLDFMKEFGVGRSDRPKGPFEFYGHVKNADGSIFREGFPYDPSIFIDDDGRIYLYYGFVAHFLGGTFGSITPSPGCLVVELEEDMLTVKNGPKLCLPGDTCCQGTSFSPQHAYFEAPSMRKIGDIYYLVYSSQSQHELCYAVSRYPDREFKYGGVIISNGDIGYCGNTKAVNYTGTNHGGLVNILGKWFIFYHRNTHGMVCSRQGCAEKIEIAEDGSIAQVPVSSVGLYARPFPGEGYFPAYSACYLERMDSQVHMKPRMDYKQSEPYFFEENENGTMEHYIANISDRTRWGYKEFLLEENTTIRLEVRGCADGKITISADRGGENILSVIDVHVDSSEWEEIKGQLGACAGVYSLFFTFGGSGTLQFRSMRLEGSGEG